MSYYHLLIIMTDEIILLSNWSGTIIFLSVIELIFFITHGNIRNLRLFPSVFPKKIRKLPRKDYHIYRCFPKVFRSSLLTARRGNWQFRLQKIVNFFSKENAEEFESVLMKIVKSLRMNLFQQSLPPSCNGMAHIRKFVDVLMCPFLL